MVERDFVHLGTLTRAHGLKGEIGTFWHAEGFDLLRGAVYLQAQEETPRKVVVTGVRLHKGYPLLLLQGVADRNAAEALRGHKVLIPRSALPKPSEGEFYIIDLEGCSAHLPKDSGEAGERIGVVDGVDFSSGQEIWSIRTDSGQEILFPAVPEFVRQIDIAAKVVIIDPPPGLLELYL